MRTRVLLPLLALSVFAACDGGRGTAPRQSPEDVLGMADQVMWPMSAALTDRGLLRAELESDTAYFFDESARLELKRVRLQFYGATGEKTSLLTSVEGTHHTRTGRSEARRDVAVVSEDGRRLTTEHLLYDQHADQISSDSAFVYVPEPGRELRGIGFVSDPDLRNVRILRQPEATGTVELP
jgi:LPS export ABC transporter protein LptC